MVSPTKTLLNVRKKSSREDGVRQTFSYTIFSETLKGSPADSFGNV